MNLNDNFDSTVALARVPVSAYAEGDGRSSLIATAISRLGSDLGWSRQGVGKGAFGELIQPGARVLIKPNFVLHHNQGSGGMQPMITHQSVIKAVVEAVLLGDPSEVLVGDAPIQTCDFPALLSVTGL